jgi:hypothetical protein
MTEIFHDGRRKSLTFQSASRWYELQTPRVCGRLTAISAGGEKGLRQTLEPQFSAITTEEGRGEGRIAPA